MLYGELTNAIVEDTTWVARCGYGRDKIDALQAN